MERFTKKNALSLCMRLVVQKLKLSLGISGHLCATLEPLSQLDIIQ